MKETLRRIFVVVSWVIAVVLLLVLVWFFHIREPVGIFPFPDPNWKSIMGLFAVPIGVGYGLHMLTNWIFQKGEDAD